jgi:hypothetical protein
MLAQKTGSAVVALFLTTGFALFLATGSARACTGEEIFADDFSDPALSEDFWGVAGAKGRSVGKGYLEIKPQMGYVSFATIPSGRDVKEFDVCADVTYPEAKNPDGGTIGGFIFLFKDWDNYYEVGTTPVGGLAVFRNAKGKGTAVSAPFKVYDQLKKGAGSTNTIRVLLKGNTGTVFGNGQRLTAFRTVAADAAAATVGVALYASSEKEQENGWKFGNVKLTEPPK